MEQYYSSIILDNQDRLAGVFNLTEEFYDALVATHLFPNEYVSYLKELNIDARSKKKNFLIDVTKRSPPSFDILSKIFREQFGSNLLEDLHSENCYPNVNPGYCLIINNEKFPNNPTIDRTGSDLDAEKLKKMFEGPEFGFRVEVRKDVTRDEMLELLDHASQDDRLETEDLMVLFVGSHGVSSSVIASDHQEISFQEIITRFSDERCPKLANKPKIFIFNCCREPDQKLNPEPETEVRDTVMIFSTLNSKLSWRDEDEGSQFVTAFLEAVQKYTELTQVLNETQRLLNNQAKIWQGVEIRKLAIHKTIYLRQG